MRVRFVDAGAVRSWFSESGIDALAEHVHEMAAVARDRDCGDIPLDVATDDLPGLYITWGCAMRVEKLRDGTWQVMTGPVGNSVAVWDEIGLRWLRRHQDTDHWIPAGHHYSR